MSYNIKHFECLGNLLLLILVSNFLPHHLQELDEVQGPSPVLVGGGNHLLDLGLCGVVANISQDFPQILPIDISIPVGVKSVKCPGVSLYLVWWEALVRIHHCNITKFDLTPNLSRISTESGREGVSRIEQRERRWAAIHRGWIRRTRGVRPRGCGLWRGTGDIFRVNKQRQA